MKKLIILVIVIISSSSIIKAQQSKKYSAQEVRDDLEYMYDMLEKCSYDLFALNSKENMDKMYAGIYQSINDSLSQVEVFRKFNPLVAAAKMSHCMMNYPWRDYLSYAKNGGTLFPLSVYFSGGRALVSANYSTNSTINKHDEILSVNGKSIDEFLDGFYENMSGPSKYYINASIESKGLPRAYWCFFGEQKSFRLKIKTSNGIISSQRVNATLASDYEEIIKEQATEEKNERTFQFLNDHVAFLSPVAIPLRFVP